ncbi:MAG: DUF4838 domain-containing protein [Armatimonadetes bacterium]|nr:DUF4838 domain-containing protein [Armatimonadota bacterium]
MNCTDLIRLTVLTLVAAGICACASPHPEWKNALKPKGKPGPELTLASGGKTAYTIVLPSSPTSQEEKAATELRKWLGEMTGAEFPIAVEVDGYKPSGRAISIGRTSLLEKSGIPPSDLGNEGYEIAVRGRTLFLLGGKTRGPINAVLALLEEDLGCRWYDRQSAAAADYASVPKTPDLRFRPVPRRFAPVLEIRDPFYWDAFDGAWSLMNRTNSPWAAVPEEFGGYIDYAMFVHTYEALVPQAKYFKDHPEYYSELNGERKPVQLCLTNPDVLRIVVEGVKAKLREMPHSEIISVSPNDTTGYCECAQCRAIDDAEGSKSGTLIKFCNEVADAIRGEFSGVKVSTLAYLGTFMPPKTIKPRDNVAIQLCTDSHAWSRPFLLVTETEKFQAAMKAWAALGATTHIWDYTTNFSHYSLPMPNMQVVTPDIRWYIEHNAKGVMLQGSYQSPGSDNGILRSWVWAKQLWDPSLDTRALMRDFVFGYYGAAAGPIWEYNDLLWDIWEDYHGRPHTDDNPLMASIRYTPDIGFLSTGFREKSLALFEAAEKLARTPETARRVRLAKLPVIYTELCRGLGFNTDGGELVPGTRREGVDYAALVEQFARTVAEEKVTVFRETWEPGEAQKRVQFHRDRLASDGGK